MHFFRCSKVGIIQLWGRPEASVLGLLCGIDLGLCDGMTKAHQIMANGKRLDVGCVNRQFCLRFFMRMRRPSLHPSSILPSGVPRRRSLRALAYYGTGMSFWGLIARLCPQGHFGQSVPDVLDCRQRFRPSGENLRWILTFEKPWNVIKITSMVW
jgi:hypothetical protein